MVAIMNTDKTPVSQLQEMMVKKGEIVTYELVHDGGGTHENTFTYKVECNGVAAIGTGRDKRSAKHEAALAMLKKISEQSDLLQITAAIVESPVRTPLPLKRPIPLKAALNGPFRNAIGELKQFCIEKLLNDPEYKEISVYGPAHQRVFTIQCTVSTFVEEGIAPTKKQAKHEAADKMLECIKSVVWDDTTQKEPTEEMEADQIESSKNAIKLYPTLSVINNESGKSKINWGLKIINFHLEFRRNLPEEVSDNIEDFLQKLNKIRQSTENMAKSTDLESLLEPLQISPSYSELESNCINTKIANVRLNTSPPIDEIGLGLTDFQAKTNALNNLLDTLITFCNVSNSECKSMAKSPN